jgi:hypothetical protein
MMFCLLIIKITNCKCNKFRTINHVLGRNYGRNIFRRRCTSIVKLRQTSCESSPAPSNDLMSFVL